MSFKIRTAMPADLACIVRFLKDHNAEAGHPPRGMAPQTVRAAMFGKNAFVFGDLAVVRHEDGGEEIAASALSHDCFTTDDGTRGLYLTDLYVAPAWRRRGMAHALMGALCRRAKRRGGTHVWWATMPNNDSARRFYRTLGASEDRAFAHALHGATFKAGLKLGQ